MSSEQVLVHYILHSNMIIGNNFAFQNTANQMLGKSPKIQILGKLNKKTLLSEVRQSYEWKKDEIMFIRKSMTKTNQFTIFSSEGSQQQQNHLNQKFEFVNINGQQTIKLMEMFDYNASIQAFSRQKDFKANQIIQFYLIHLFTTADNHQSSIVRQINTKRDGLFTANRNPGIQIFSNKKIDEMNQELNKKINKVFGDQNQKINSFIGDGSGKPIIPNTKTTGNNTEATGVPVVGLNVSPQNQTKTVTNQISTTLVTEKLPGPKAQKPMNSIVNSNNSESKRSGTNTPKVTTNYEIESILRLAKVTHRSFYKCEEIKQRSIVDFSSSKIQLINAYKNFFYEKQVILKDQMQAKYLKESLNTIEFNLDVGAPSAALDTKIGMALLKTNNISQQSYIHNESFSQIHIAYSFQEAYQIQPENIMLNLNLRNTFKQVFMLYVVLCKMSENAQVFYSKSISELSEIKDQLETFFKHYGSQIQTGMFVFGGKYMAQTNFKFLTNLDLKSKEKVRNTEGKFTIQGGYMNVNSGAKIQDRQLFQDHVATQNAVISRSYILFPGTSKNLAQWNNNLESSRQDWKLILKDSRKIFIGQVLSNPLNSEQYRLINAQAFPNFIKKAREYFEDVSNSNKKAVDEGLEQFRKNRLFVLWKEDIIKTLRVIKLVPIGSNQPIISNSEINKNETDRKLISEEQLHGVNKPRQKNKKIHQQEKQQKGCFKFNSRPQFYILVRNKEIQEAYKSILNDSESEERRQNYDSCFERFFYKYLCCCLVPKKPQLTQVQMKRRKYINYFSAERNQTFFNHTDLQIYNMEIENQYNRLRQVNEFKLPSQIISSSPKIKHIFDLTQQYFQEGKIEGLISRTISKADLFNRSQLFEIYFSIEFVKKKEGLINLLQKGQQEHVIVRVQNIRKVNSMGEVIEQTVDQYAGIFFNCPSHEHLMLIQKLSNSIH